MIGNNSCGVHSIMAGKTDDNIEALDILTYDGTACTSAQPAKRISSASSRRRTPRQIYPGSSTR